jgi:NADPH:quinone reductase-like Zn-dependent oxidoreductase
MKAYVVEQPGGPEVLQLRDIAAPEPADDEVHVRVRAFGINRAEVYWRAGQMGAITTARVPGIEAVGEVIHDPAGTFRTGQRIATAMGGMQFGRNGSYAEQVTVLRSNVVALDGSELSWAELAALPEAYLTVWGALDKSLRIQPGQSLLVRGATSSVGLAAVAYAKARGLRVIATTRAPANSGRLREVGADEVLVDTGAIGESVREIAAEGVDAALEIVGASTLRDTIKTLRPFGAVSVIGLLGGPPILDRFHLMQDLPVATQLSFFPGVVVGTPAMPMQDSPLPWIAKETAARRMPSLRTMTFDFDDVRRAHSVMESDRALGKLVVQL